MPITLQIQLISKPEMTFDEMKSYISQEFPLEDNDEGFITSGNPEEGTVSLEFNAQDSLTDEQRDWLHISTFAARYIDSYKVNKPETLLHKGQTVKVISGEKCLDQVGIILASDEGSKIHIVEIQGGNMAPFYESELEPLTSPKTQELMQAMQRLMIALAQLDNPEHALELLDMVLAANPTTSDRYISGIQSTCKNCGYQEMIEVPEQASPLDIINAMQAVRGNCPECEERLRRVGERDALADSLGEILHEDVGNTSLGTT